MKFTLKESGRLNKIIANIGIYSRREIDKIIENGKVTVDNKLAILGQKVNIGSLVEIKDNQKETLYFLYYKKRGEITDTKTFTKNNKIYSLPSVGRLDKESEGLIFYSNDNLFIQKILSPEHKTEKEYIVTTKENIRSGIADILLKGVQTQEDIYAPAKAVTLFEDNPKQIRIVLTEGKKHEIRRILNALNLTINTLKRIRIDSWKNTGIKAGTYIEISSEDIQKRFKI